MCIRDRSMCIFIMGYKTYQAGVITPAWLLAIFWNVLAHNYQVLAEISDRCAAVLFHDDRILDAHPEVIGTIDTRLHSHDIPGRERCIGVWRETRILMDLEPDTVAEAVAKSKTVLCQLGTDSGIDSP